MTMRPAESMAVLMPLIYHTLMADLPEPAGCHNLCVPKNLCHQAIFMNHVTGGDYGSCPPLRRGPGRNSGPPGPFSHPAVVINSVLVWTFRFPCYLPQLVLAGLVPLAV